ncbi:MAG: YHS domain-containing protein [Pseudomonadota bacterium]|nr:YHS domain-containing protein [Pseudomonadota bacterium]
MPVDTLVTVKDPVCDMDVDPRKPAARREVEGRTYYFCSTVCAASFDADPSYYIDEQAPPQKE